MKNNDKNNKRGLIERLVCDYDIPPEIFSGGCFVELHGRNKVVIRGCRRIIKYSSEEIILKMLREIVEIRGKRLTYITYLAGAVSVEGLVDSVGFVKRNGKGE